MSPFDGESPTTTVHVTAELIAKGRPARCVQCPVALAFLAAGFSGVIVVDLFWFYQHRWRALPEMVIDFIKRFDHGLPVKPISFTVPARPTGSGT